MVTLVKKIVVFLILFHSILSFSQQTEIAINYGVGKCDYLLNSYSFSAHRLVKYDISGNEVARYDNQRNGNIADIDVSNPMRICMYYKDYNKVLFLDKALTPISQTIDLNIAGYTNNQFVCGRMPEGLVVYDNVLQQLVFLDANLKKDYASNSLNQYTNNLDFIMMERNSENVYLQNTLGEVLIFNRYGSFVKKINLQTEFPVYLKNKELFYLKNDTIFKQHTGFIDKKVVYSLPKNLSKYGLLSFFISNEKVCLIFRNKIIKSQIMF